MPASMMRADTGARLNVIGRSIAIVATGPMPGSTPISVPSITPIRQYSRFIGETATPKPMTRLWKISIMAWSLERRGPQREGQRQPLHEDQHGENDQDDEQDRHFLPLELVAAEGADEHERERGEHQPERLHEVAVRHAAGGDQHQRLRL